MDEFPYKDTPPERPESHIAYVLVALVVMLFVWLATAR